MWFKPGDVLPNDQDVVWVRITFWAFVPYLTVFDAGLGEFAFGNGRTLPWQDTGRWRY